MTTLIENDSKEVAKILLSTGRSILDIFTNNEALEVMLDLISNELKNRWIDEPGLSEDKQRKVLISRARSIASVSLRLDEIGKEEVSRLKELPKKIDAGRRQAKAYFDEWKEYIRRPVTEWESKQADLKAAAQILLDHEEALELNRLFNMEMEHKRLLDEKIKASEIAELKQQIREEVGQENTKLEVNNYSSSHKTFVHRELLNFFIENTTNLSKEDAKQLITAIIKKGHPHIKVCY